MLSREFLFYKPQNAFYNWAIKRITGDPNFYAGSRIDDIRQYFADPYLIITPEPNTNVHFRVELGNKNAKPDLYFLEINCSLQKILILNDEYLTLTPPARVFLFPDNGRMLYERWRPICNHLLPTTYGNNIKLRHVIINNGETIEIELFITRSAQMSFVAQFRDLDKLQTKTGMVPSSIANEGDLNALLAFITAENKIERESSPRPWR